MTFGYIATEYLNIITMAPLCLTYTGNENLRDSAGRPVGIQRVASTLHWGMFWNEMRYRLTKNLR